ncbi:hypothetical protein ACFVAJ_18810 [Agromyces sp. NPDC057679]|uniref:hypothetical protein n=1 Tax=Agromyces sp. NPDC057679 TaxID=3346207 RepID=UPI003671A492
MTIDDVIDYMEATDAESWCVDVVRTEDGAGNCFFGHLFGMGRDQQESNLLWEWFEECWSTTYAVYPVNDGKNPEYQQPNPRDRVVAYLRALRDGDELTTPESMERDYLASIAA